MRSKAPPPMSGRVAMQFHRDGAKRSFRTSAAELSLGYLFLKRLARVIRHIDGPA
jgi:hypothetical protein